MYNISSRFYCCCWFLFVCYIIVVVQLSISNGDIESYSSVEIAVVASVQIQSLNSELRRYQFVSLPLNIFSIFLCCALVST